MKKYAAINNMYTIRHPSIDLVYDIRIDPQETGYQGEVVYVGPHINYGGQRWFHKRDILFETDDINELLEKYFVEFL